VRVINHGNITGNRVEKDGIVLLTPLIVRWNYTIGSQLYIQQKENSTTVY